MIQWALLCVGLVALFRADWLVARRHAKHAARLAEINAGAPEQLFEERRELLAYPPPRRARLVRLFGAVTTMAMAAALFVDGGAAGG